jgi:hypothetical protein
MSLKENFFISFPVIPAGNFKLYIVSGDKDGESHIY